MNDSIGIVPLCFAVSGARVRETNYTELAKMKGIRLGTDGELIVTTPGDGRHMGRIGDWLLSWGEGKWLVVDDDTLRETLQGAVPEGVIAEGFRPEANEIRVLSDVLPRDDSSHGGLPHGDDLTRIEHEFFEAMGLHNRKSEDYTAGRGEFWNFERAGEVFGLSREDVCDALIGVKIARLEALRNQEEPNFEAIEDTRRDLAIYLFIRNAMERDDN